MRLDDLWQFMQVDMEADRFESKMRQSENRQKLLKQRSFLMDQQANMKKIEADIAAMQDRLEAVNDEAQRLEKQLDALTAEIEANPPKSIEDAEKSIQTMEKLNDTLSHYEQELSKIRKDSEIRDRQQKEIRVRAARTKVEYDQLKQLYDKEYKVDLAQLQQLRAGTEKAAQTVDPALLERYRAIKQHCTPPMAKLVAGQCAGCFMALPSATLLKLKEGDGIVECDNCGRIIYMTEENQ